MLKFVSPAGRAIANVREMIIEMVQIKQRMSVYLLDPLQVGYGPVYIALVRHRYICVSFD